MKKIASSEKRIWIACKRAKPDEEKRGNALRHLAVMLIPKRMKAAVERLRECMAGDQLHDPVAVASVAAFFLGLELQDQFPEFSRKIKPHTRATRANSTAKEARWNYARRRFIELREQYPRRCRTRDSIIREAVSDTKRKFHIVGSWPCKRIKVEIFKGLK